MATDQFAIETSYEDAENIFGKKNKSIAEIRDECIIFLDTNVLLAPYNLNDKTIDQIKISYLDLVRSDRLFIAAQVAREFAKNRAARIGDILQTILDQSSRLQSPISKQFSLLKNLPSYQESLTLCKEIETKQLELGEKLRSVAKEIRGWDTSDPVWDMYRDILKNRILEIDPSIKIKLPEELKFRSKHKIPPGYNDDQKSDMGSGDLIIWKTIIQHSKKLNKDAIFVTLDQKSDWWTQAAGGPLFMRNELRHEFTDSTGGKSIHLQLFSDFMSDFGVESKIIKQIKDVEEDEMNKESSDSLFEEYDLPKIILHYLGIKERLEKVEQRIKGRSFALMRNKSTGDIDKITNSREILRELRQERKAVLQTIEKMETRFPIVIEYQNLRSDNLDASEE